MTRKKVDERLRILIENGVKTRTRSFVVLVGDRGKDQVPNLHYILTKAQVKARPSVLWCYNKELGFSTHRQKRMKAIKKLQAKGVYDADRDDPFELFISSTNIRWCYYKETQRILGSTYGMLVLQDFEAITPNILCRTMETVEGGGVVVLLLRTMNSLRQLYSLTMDVHSRFRTEAHADVVGRFNERFLLSMANCATCLILDDELNVLPLSRHAKHIVPVSLTNEQHSQGGIGKGGAEGTEKKKKITGFAMADEMLAAAGVDFSGGRGGGGSSAAQSAAQAGRALSASEAELEELKATLAGTPLVGALAACTRTLDQAKAVMTFAEAISEKTLASTVALTAGRGRGKSSALGLAIAAAVGYGYSNIFVTAPSPENLKTLFEFVFKGLEALSYKEHSDYEAVASTNPEWGNAVVRVNIFGKGHRQTVAYIAPGDADKLTQAELLVVDEAAAIPLPVVKRLLGPYLVFLASTINGYEGTGRALSLKLVQQLRTAALTNAQQGSSAAAGGGGSGSGPAGRTFREIALKEPIRYAAGDGVEAWLNDLLCLDAVDPPRLRGGLGARLPAPTECELYCVDRDALFSGHKISEAFLKRVWGLYVSSHYKNSPNDLQLLSDAPAHRLFVLLGPQGSSGSGGEGEGPKLPDVLVVIQVCLEGKISRESLRAQLARGARSSGDLIPWTVSQQFQDEGFAALSGARIVRIATHPDAAKMGYGTRAMQLLTQYYEGKLSTVQDEEEEEEDVAVDRGLRPQEEEGEEERDVADDAAAGGDGDGGDGEEGGAPRDKLHTEKLKPRKALPPLLVPAGDITRPERLHWIGVSYGLTQPLFSFWHRSGFLPVYLRQTANDLTAEHTMIMMRGLDCSGVPGAPKTGWVTGFVADFGRRFLQLLSAEFRSYDLTLALSVADAACSVMGVSSAGAAAGGGEDAEEEQSSGAAASAVAAGSKSGGRAGDSGSGLTPSQLAVLFTPHDLGRMEAYARNLVDYHLILDLVPDVARLYFTGRLPSVHLPRLQAGILLSIGLQRLEVDAVAASLNVPGGQILALFNKSLRKISTALNGVLEGEITASLDAQAAAAQAQVEAARGKGAAGHKPVAKAAAASTTSSGQEGKETGGAGSHPGLASLLADPSLSRFAVPSGDKFQAALSGLKDKAVRNDRAGALAEGVEAPKTLSLPREGPSDAGGSKRDKEGKKGDRKAGRDRDGQELGTGSGAGEAARSHPDGMYGGAVDKMKAGAKKLRRE